MNQASRVIAKTVLITGCSSGIGSATAQRLAQEGWTVYATARHPETLARLHAAGCHTLALDVTNESAMREVVTAIERKHGAVGVLINNAGYSQTGALEELSPEQLRRQFETNVFGLLRLTQLVLPGMRTQRWGKVINISSIGGKLTLPGGGAYHASKHAIEALSDALRFEVRGFGIDVIVVEPGLIRTEFAKTTVGSLGALSLAGSPYAEFTKAVVRRTQDAYVKPPLSWLGGEPDAVARVVSKAMRARRPRARYAVTPSARMFLWTRKLLPDRLWDALMRTQYPEPKVA